MSGAFFFEHIVESILNLEQRKTKKTESTVLKADSVKKPKKK